MRIYKTRWFNRWTRKQGLNNLSLCLAVREMMEGLYEVDLGGGLVKKRIARTGQGKSGGFRTLVATNRGDRWIFVFGFAKSDRGNINKQEEEALKKLSNHLLALSVEDLAMAQRNDELIEVICNEEISNS